MKDEIIKKAFDRVRPSEELVHSVLNFDHETVRTKRKISARRIIGTAAAVCAVLAFGVTVAAGTGLISFEKIFRGQVKVNDSALADELWADVSDFRYSISDEDYMIRIKGVTGSEGDIISVLEIVRKDGTPVSEHFKNLLLSSDDIGLDNFSSGLHADNFDNYIAGFGTYVNEAGNIEIYTEFNGNKSPGSKTVSIRGKNSYPAERYSDYLDENDVYNMDGINYTGYVKKGSTHDDYTPVDFDDSGIILLELDWELSFVFTPSQKAGITKMIGDPSEDFQFKQGVKGFLHDEGSDTVTGWGVILVYTNTANVTCIKADSSGIQLDFSYPMNEYEKNVVKYSTEDFYETEMFVILNDGERINVVRGGGYTSYDDGILTKKYILRYDSGDGGGVESIVYEDVDNIAGFSVNGTVYMFE